MKKRGGEQINIKNFPDYQCYINKVYTSETFHTLTLGFDVHTNYTITLLRCCVQQYIISEIRFPNFGSPNFGFKGV